jgi:hypothetical protein
VDLTSRCRAAGINGGLSGAALQKHKAAEMSVRGVLTAMSVKIPITKLLKMAILHLKLLLLLELCCCYVESY